MYNFNNKLNFYYFYFKMIWTVQKTMVARSLYVIPFLILLGAVAYAQTGGGEAPADDDDASQSPLRMDTDMSEYVYGDTVIMSAQTSVPIPGEALSYYVSDPNGKVIHREKVVNADGNFDNRIPLTGNLVHGTYVITADYGDQHASATFEVTGPVIPDIVQTAASLTVGSDMDVYATGDTMLFSGVVEDIDSYSASTPVKITISYNAAASAGISRQAGSTSDYTIISLPDSTGSFSAQVKAISSIFGTGIYVATATYIDGAATDTFQIVEPLNLDDAAIATDRDVYGYGQTVYLNGTISPSAVTSLDITLTRPDRTVEEHQADISDQGFSWSWTIPAIQPVGGLDPLDILGFYTIGVSSENTDREIIFKVSEDPENDSLTETPILVRTDKPAYLVEETFRVTGNVIVGDDQGGALVPDRVTIQVNDGIFSFRHIDEAQVYPDQDGEFSSVFNIPITVFEEGTYFVRAIYGDSQAETSFEVVSEIEPDAEERIVVFASPDKSKYNPGDAIVITGGTNGPTDITEFEVSIVQISGTACEPDVCQTASVAPGGSGQFTHTFVIPDIKAAIGKYTVVVEAGAEAASAQFQIVGETPDPMVIFEKGHRIPERMITVATGERAVDGTTFEPRVVFGSVVTTAGSSTSDVNLRVLSDAGTCIIGTADDCLVSESTRRPGQIYDTVDVDGMMLNVRYSGPDVQVEKFTILPESDDAALPDAGWNIEVVKADEQVSRFYYKVTYRTAAAQ